MRILIDVDLTIVSDNFHNFVLPNLTRKFPYINEDYRMAVEEWQLDPFCDIVPYDLTQVFDGMEHSDMQDIYGAIDLYDDSMPEPGVKPFVDVATAMGHKVIFVSKCVGEHHLSKMRFMQRHFPGCPVFLTGSSIDRCHIEADIFIDDSAENHVIYDKVQPHWIKQYLRATPFNSGEIPSSVDKRFTHWDDLMEVL